MNPVREHNKARRAVRTDNRAGFAVVGAGLSKTGTMSLREALAMLLDGICYHGGNISTCDDDELDFWESAVAGKEISAEDWDAMLRCRGVRAGVDMPINVFYKELMAAFPDCKVILTERDPDAWFDSCVRTLTMVERVRNEWAVRTFFRLIGMLRRMEMYCQIGDYVYPPCGKSLKQAIREGRASAKEFYSRWTADVRASVPAERLLVYHVGRDGWGPLCQFLEVPEPEEPFPKVNDKQSAASADRMLGVLAYGTVVGLPVLTAGVAFAIYRLLA